MKDIQVIYNEVADLIEALKAENKGDLSNMLSHRMYKVSWTSSYELLDELKEVVHKIILVNNDVNQKTVEKANHIVKLIDEFTVPRKE